GPTNRTGRGRYSKGSGWPRPQQCCERSCWGPLSKGDGVTRYTMRTSCSSISTLLTRARTTSPRVSQSGSSSPCATPFLHSALSPLPGPHPHPRPPGRRRGSLPVLGPPLRQPLPRRRDPWLEFRLVEQPVAVGIDEASDHRLDISHHLTEICTFPEVSTSCDP